MDHDELMKLAQQIARGRAGPAGLDQHAVDDLAQEVLARYFEAWPGTQKPDNPAAWLQRVAGNAAIDQLRADKRKPADKFAPDGDVNRPGVSGGSFSWLSRSA